MLGQELDPLGSRWSPVLICPKSMLIVTYRYIALVLAED